MFQLAAFIISLAGAGFIALNVSGKQLNEIIPPGLGGSSNFTDNAGNKKYFSPLKMKAWGETQTCINNILSSPAWKNWRTLDSFKRLTNGGKIDAVIKQIGINYSGALYGFGFSPPLIPGPDAFSYLDFVWPGIDLKNLGAGSENAFTILWEHLNLQCVYNAISNSSSSAAAGAETGGEVGAGLSAASLYEKIKACYH